MSLVIAEYSEQENVLSKERRTEIVLAIFLFAIAIFLLINIGYMWGMSKPCNCTVNYGGHNMSVEDAFERSGEGLTVDQADEVQVLIEKYCDNGGE
jgi:hypothetical protein